MNLLWFPVHVIIKCPWFKQLDTVGKLRYKEKLGMLGVTTDPYSTSRDVWPAH